MLQTLVLRCRVNQDEQCVILSTKISMSKTRSIIRNSHFEPQTPLGQVVTAAPCRCFKRAMTLSLSGREYRTESQLTATVTIEGNGGVKHNTYSLVGEENTALRVAGDCMRSDTN